MTDSTMPIAEPWGEKDGKRIFLLGSEEVDEDELQARCAKAHEKEDRERELDRELNSVLPLAGYAVHAAAMKDLHERRIFQPSAEEYLTACERVAP
jgi:hypothetical protein